MALGEQTGSIVGKITEAATKLPLPGVRVRALGEHTGGILGQVQTDKEGHYLLIALPPDRYTVEILHAEAVPYRQSVRVGPGEHVTLDIAWKILARSEQRIIIERVNPTRPDSAATGNTLIARSLATLATQRTFLDASLLVPGTRDPAIDGNPNVKGGLVFGNRYLIDGIEVTDPVTSTYTANINFDSISAIDVITGGMEAQYNTLGGIINVVTHSGSPKWHVDASAYASPDFLRATKTYGSSVLTEQRPLSHAEDTISQRYSASLNTGGPVLANRLWVHASLQYGYSEFSIPQGPPLDMPHPSRQTHEVLARMKLTYKASDKHLLNLSVFTSPLIVNNTVQSNRLLAVAEDYREQGGVFATLHWDALLSKRMSLSVQANFLYNYINTGPQGILGGADLSGYDPTKARHENLDDETIWNQGSILGLERRHAIGLDPSLSIRAQFWGRHEFKVGVQSRVLVQGSHSEQPGEVVYYDLKGGPGIAGLCEPSKSDNGCYRQNKIGSLDVEASGIAVGAFVQDRWRPISRLLILPGVRIDGGYGHASNRTGDLTTGQWGIGPRIGFTLDLTGDQRTLLTGFYGRATETFSLLPVTTASRSQAVILESRRYNKVGRDFSIEASGSISEYSFDSNAQPPQSDEVTLSLRRLFADSVAVNLDYTYKHMSRLWDIEEQNRIWDPSGTRVVGYLNGKAEDINRFTTRAGNQRTYHGVDLILSILLNKRLEVFAAYTLSWLYGNTADVFGQVYGARSLSQNHNPRLASFFYGYLPEDVRHQLRLRAAYTTHGVTLGTTLQYSTGTPLNPLYYSPDDEAYSLLRSQVGTSLGSDRNDPERISELRSPDLILLKARISWDLHPLIRQRVVIILDCFNLLNSSTPVKLQTRVDSTYGNVLVRLTPFHAQVGIRYLY